MTELQVENSTLNRIGYWQSPITNLDYVPSAEDVALFDQTGYDLTPIERMYATANNEQLSLFSGYRYNLSRTWITQADKKVGAVLNHSRIFERKSYKGEAIDQLSVWARELPLLFKITAIRSKWGLDFSMDYVDNNGNAFEVLHWEYDDFDFYHIAEIKERIEKILLNIDWDHAANKILKRKEDWYNLEYFAQSDWKCDYFGIPHEKFKIVTWK